MDLSVLGHAIFPHGLRDTEQALLCSLPRHNMFAFPCFPSLTACHSVSLYPDLVSQLPFSVCVQISSCLIALCPFKAGARNLALFLSYWIFHFSFRNIFPKTAGFGLWPGNCLITEGIWASVTEGRIGSIMFSSKFRERKWDLNTTGYCPALILKDLSSETTNKSCLLVARLQDCFLAHLAEALPSFFTHSPQVF